MRTQTKLAALMVAPLVIHQILFEFVPILYSIFVSLNKWDLISDPTFVGLENYSNILSDPLFKLSIMNTAVFAVVSVFLTTLFALGLALLVNQQFKGTTFFRLVFFFPYIFSWVAVGYMWKWLFNPYEYGGILSYLLTSIGFTSPNFLGDPNWAMFSVVVMSIWRSVGYLFVVYLAGLQEIPESYYEQAQIDGASRFERFRHITLPLIASTNVYVFVISVINGFQVFAQVFVLTGGGPMHSTKVLAQYIYEVAFRYYKVGYASSLSVVLLVVMFLVTQIPYRYFKSKEIRY
jgi:multiple sugar transport system permease protein